MLRGRSGLKSTHSDQVPPPANEASTDHLWDESFRRESANHVTAIAFIARTGDDDRGRIDDSVWHHNELCLKRRGRI